MPGAALDAGDKRVSKRSLSSGSLPSSEGMKIINKQISNMIPNSDRF